MPHVVIKAIRGTPPEKVQETAEEIKAVITRTMGKQEKYTSVSIEEYSFGEWEGVYNECIKDNDNVLIKPGYSNPKTLE